MKVLFGFYRQHKMYYFSADMSFFPLPFLFFIAIFPPGLFSRLSPVIYYFLSLFSSCLAFFVFFLLPSFLYSAYLKAWKSWKKSVMQALTESSFGFYFGNTGWESNVNNVVTPHLWTVWYFLFVESYVCSKLKLLWECKGSKII